MWKLSITFLSIGISLILSGALFKVLDWEMPSLLIFLGLIFQFFALIFYLVFRFQVWKEYPGRKYALLTLSVGALFVVFGAYCKLMTWPGAQLILLIGLATEVVALISYFASGKSGPYGT